MLAGCGGEDRPSDLRATPAPEEGGDEAGNRVPVRVLLARRRLSASDAAVPAFLALRFRVVNRLDRRVRVVVERSGGEALGRATVPAGGRTAIDVEGQRAGDLEVRAPDLDAVPATVAVRPGAG